MEDEESSGLVVYQVADSSSLSRCMKLDVTKIEFETFALSLPGRVRLSGQPEFTDLEFFFIVVAL